MKKNLKIEQVHDLPGNLDAESIYVLLPKNFSQDFYNERTDRNIGWITKEEQELLRKSVVGIAGCGGMGGTLAQALLRLGVGEIRIADCETFDISNINRQFAAIKSTIGKSKAFETARLLRNISDDIRLVVYPMGITDEIVSDFVSGCGLIIDEIEFWELEAPIILHRAARTFNVDILGCNTSGFGTHLFLFTSSSMTIEETFGVTLEEAREIDDSRRNNKISNEKLTELVNRLIITVVPEFKNYNPNEFEEVFKRLFTEGKASIISTNPLFATGVLADNVLLHLLRNSKTDGLVIPPMPGYAYLDARRMEAKIVDKKWW